MTHLPTSSELTELEIFTEPNCVSIYSPAVDMGGTRGDNPARIELKNLLNQAENELLSLGAEPGEANQTLERARDVIGRPDFRPLGRQSFALFAHPALFRLYNMRAELPQIVSVGQGFYLEPLREVVSNNIQYLVLALSHHHVRILEGDRYGLRDLALRNFPENMEESLGIDEYPKAWETHPIGQGGGRGSEGFHGQYNVRQTDKQMLFLFFRKIDKSLHRFLQQRQEPVVLAGVEYLLPIYRKANTSPYLLPGTLTGNFEHDTPEQIHQQAWELVKQVEGMA